MVKLKWLTWNYYVDQDNTVDIATHYGLDGLGANPSKGEVSRTCTDRPWVPRSLLYNGYRVFPRVKWLGRGIDHPLPSSTEVKERVELYICSPSGPSWPVLGWTLPFTFLPLTQNYYTYRKHIHCYNYSLQVHKYTTMWHLGAWWTTLLYSGLNLIT